MGLGGISIWQLLIILLIVIMVFGTKRLKNIGSDLGGAIKGFKKSIQDDDEQAGAPDDQKSDVQSSTQGNEIENDTPASADNTQRKHDKNAH